MFIRAIILCLLDCIVETIHDMRAACWAALL